MVLCDKEKRMKNRIFLFVLALGVAILFSSCLNLFFATLDKPETYRITLDEYSPADKNITLTFDGSLILKRWNKSDMEETMYEKKSIYTKDKFILTMPAGNSSFLFDVYVIFDKTTSYTSYRIPNVELSYLLEDGKKYQFKTRAKSLGSSKGYDFFIGIYDVTKRSVLLEEWKIGANK
jgi:hypothetical protein